MSSGIAKWLVMACVHRQAQRTQAIVQGGFPDRFVPLHPGGSPDVVHQNVQAALLVLDPSHQGGRLVGHEMVHPAIPRPAPRVAPATNATLPPSEVVMVPSIYYSD